jgi:hypothetical protein
MDKQENWKPENEILMNCIGVGADALNSHYIESLAISDWESIILKASNHNIAPTLYYCLGKNGLNDYVPREFLQKLRKIYLASLSRNMRIYKQLSKLILELKNENINVIVLKGAALAELIYETIALRPMGDVDLIVKGEDLKRLNQILLEWEWINEEYFNKIGPHEKYSKHINYTNGKIGIEVHPKLYEIPYLDPWVNAVNTKIASVDTFILGTEDFMMHLCLHLDDHYRTGMVFNLIWYLDVVKFIEQHKDNINWDYVIMTSKRNNVEGSMHRVLKAINENCSGYITQEILSQFKNDQIELHVAEALNSISNPIRDFNSLLSEAFGPRILPIGNRIYIALSNIFPCKAYMIRRYRIKNEKFFFFYYFLRIIMGFSKFFKGLYYLPGYLKKMK